MWIPRCNGTLVYGNANLPPYAFGGPSKADGFNLNVVKLTLEKPIEPSDVWAAGYKVDLLAGPDANAFNTQTLGTHGDFGVKQAYVALHAPIGNGLDFKLGVWDTIIGYEVFESGNNPNITRSYGYSMEPTTHTGLLMTYNFCESFSMNAGVANTFGPTINQRATFGGGSESFKTYMASFTFTAPTNAGFMAGSSISGGIISGANSAVASGKETSYYVGATLNTPIKGLKVGAAFDYMDVNNTSGETWCLGGYLAFQATEKLSFYGRAEYLRDRGNQKLFTQMIADTTTGDLNSVALAPDKVLELTGTLQYDLWKNVMTRLEVRWDHALAGPAVWGGNSAPSFDDGDRFGGGNQKNAVVFVAQAIYKF